MSRAYQPGDIIMPECEPLLRILFSAYKNTHCRNCFRPAHDLKSCSSCKLVKYCGQACQKEDWLNGHKLECKSTFFRTQCIAHTGIDAVYRMYALFKIQPNLQRKPFTLYDGTTRCFDDLMSHDEILLKTSVVDDWHQRLEKIKRDEPEIKLTVEDFVRYHGIFQTNSFYIPDENSVQIGAGIYVQASIFDHSCRPNAHVERIGSRAHVRAIAPIPANEKPYISYISGCMDTSKRRKVLSERYNFDCRCQRCESESDGDIDYAELKSRMEERDRLYGIATAGLQGGCQDTDPEFGWSNVYAEHEEMLKILSQMYNDYDEPVTDHFRETVGIGMNPKFLGPKEHWDWLLAETQRRISITFGKENKRKALFAGD